MPTDLPTLGAPVMIVGLLTGFFLCFYGNVAKKYLIPLRSVLSGAMVSLTVVFLVMQKDALILALQAQDSFQALLALLIGGEQYLFSVIALASVALGGLLLFALSRRSNVLAGKTVALFTAISMALFIFLLILGFLPFTLNLVVSAILLIFIIIFCLRDFATYLAFENSIGGALLISYLLARFWYLDFWIFLVWVAILSVIGIYSQLRSIKRHKAKSEQTHE
ncbi:MAG: hypothetical protein EOM68_12660 [Spirochaetia bacterium]|jgi:hypothetical protein|nr:hypothetical protein [Spirochaetia bacterium]